MAKLQLALMSVMLASCVDQEVGNVTFGVDESEIQADNGKSLNGVSLNGISLNGKSLNGISLNGISLNGKSLNGVSLKGTSLNGVSITSAARGSSWTATLSNGTTLPLRIDSASKGTGKNADVGMYAVSYNTNTGWQPLCGTNSDGTVVLAIAVAGVWNQQAGVAGGGAYSASTTQYTWACRGKTIAKCVELGYKTWTNRVPQLTSCVRMLRADYCGNGTPYTVDGQLLNVYDNVGIQVDTMNWDKEAEWTPNGARCITKIRDTRGAQLGYAKPACVKSGAVAVNDQCASSFARGAILISEYAGLQ